jgi:hypothetical protein
MKVQRWLLSVDHVWPPLSQAEWAQLEENICHLLRARSACAHGGAPAEQLLLLSFTLSGSEIRAMYLLRQDSRFDSEDRAVLETQVLALGRVTAIYQ